MVEFIKGIGKMENKMVTVFILEKMASLDKDIGRMEKESSGWMKNENILMLYFINFYNFLLFIKK